MYSKAEQKARNNGQHYHLAAILRRGKSVIRVGVNTHKTHPRFSRTYKDGQRGHCMHAEMNVLRFAKPGDEIEVMRFKKCSHERTMARPCILCVEAIRKAGIKKVRYTNWNGEWEELYL